VHTSFSQAVAVTGRLASNEPNLQNIPIRTPKAAASAPPSSPRPATDRLADYSQIELRIMAHLSATPACSRLRPGEDVHRATAGEIFGVTPLEVTSEQRRYAKVINFGLIYGMSAHGLAKNLGIERAAAANYIDRYFARYPASPPTWSAPASRPRPTVMWNGVRPPPVPAGHPRPAGGPPPGRRARRDQRADAGHRRRPDQEGDDRHVGLAEGGLRQVALILQVHDELVLEVPDEVELIRSQLPKLMAGVAQPVPLVAEVGVGANWDEAH
jgi:DNA polymerase-1